MCMGLGSAALLAQGGAQERCTPLEAMSTLCTHALTHTHTNTHTCTTHISCNVLGHARPLQQQQPQLPSSGNKHVINKLVHGCCSSQASRYLRPPLHPPPPKNTCTSTEVSLACSSDHLSTQHQQALALGWCFSRAAGESIGARPVRRLLCAADVGRPSYTVP